MYTACASNLRRVLCHTAHGRSGSTTIAEAMARPRSEEARQAALDATVDLLARQRRRGRHLRRGGGPLGRGQDHALPPLRHQAGDGRGGGRVLLRGAPDPRHRRPPPGPPRDLRPVAGQGGGRRRCPTSCRCCSPPATATPSCTRSCWPCSTSGGARSARCSSSPSCGARSTRTSTSTRPRAAHRSLRPAAHGRPPGDHRRVPRRGARARRRRTALPRGDGASRRTDMSGDTMRA